MQPISVDHESRHSPYREEAEPPPSEGTPLLRERFPAAGPAGGRDRNLVNSLVVAALLLVLATGVVIGIYLLIQQNDAENIVPPVEEALQVVSRAQWAGPGDTRLLTAAPAAARRVVAVQTDSACCRGAAGCGQLLRALQHQHGGEELPYNFVISSDGQTFEVLGWRRRSTGFPDTANALVLGFIGNFTETSPSERQMKAAKMFLVESVSDRYLEPSFDVIARDTQFSPRQLFRRLEEIKQWNKKRPDA